MNAALLDGGGTSSRRLRAVPGVGRRVWAAKLGARGTLLALAESCRTALSPDAWVCALLHSVGWYCVLELRGAGSCAF